MPSLLENLTALLADRHAVRSLAAGIGGNDDDTAAAIGPALARIIDGLATLAVDEFGTSTVAYLVDRHDTPLADEVADHLERVPTESGNVILDRVFGAERGLVVIGLASALGLAPSLVGRLLPVLAPLVTAELSRRREAEGLDEVALAKILVWDQRAITQAGLLDGTIFDGRVLETAPSRRRVAEDHGQDQQHLADRMLERQAARRPASVRATVTLELANGTGTATPETAAESGPASETAPAGDTSDSTVDGGPTTDRAADDHVDPTTEAPTETEAGVEPAGAVPLVEAEAEAEPEVEIAEPDDAGDDDDAEAITEVIVTAAEPSGPATVSTAAEPTATATVSTAAEPTPGGVLDADAPEPSVEVIEEPRAAALAWLGWAIGAVILVLLLAWLLSTCAARTAETEQASTVVSVGPADGRSATGPEAEIDIDRTGRAVALEPSPDVADPEPAAPVTSEAPAGSESSLSGSVTEVELQGAVNAILRDSGVAGAVAGDRVTLTGTVADEQRRDALEANVSILLGVAAIDNRVTIAGPEVESTSEPDRAAGSDPLPAGTTLNDLLTLDPVTFASGSPELTAEGSGVLDRVAATLLEQPGLTIEIGGHTDDDGAEDANLKLSQQRADAVLAHLVGAGIDAARLSAVGYGEASPTAPNDSLDNKARNRRIEFVVR